MFKWRKKGYSRGSGAEISFILFLHLYTQNPPASIFLFSITWPTFSPKVITLMRCGIGKVIAKAEDLDG
jgi:hypothetical protein